ncbi:hypothetical protein [Halothiobacillus diazotrophicus]|uniref:hypothetical protein n=1 Tax=Halothiobacillus diazotrophicus TaxID=1860122 RepID=UPI0012E88618|nr:hypothetical protein [Halothiobacillus diazotrophicus]
MIGLLYLGFLAGYIFLIVLAARFGAHLARRSGHNPKLWGLIAGLLVYLPVFWDFVPTVVLQCYYCATQGGFTQYKTLDKWKRENPGVSETLVPSQSAATLLKPNIRRYMLNQRFVWDVTTSYRLLHIREREDRIIDIKTGELMAQYVNFDTDVGSVETGIRDFRDYKFWLNIGSCGSCGFRGERVFYRQKYLFQYQKEFEK